MFAQWTGGGANAAAFMDNWGKSTGRVLDGDDYSRTAAGDGDGSGFRVHRWGRKTSACRLAIAAARKNIRLSASYYVPMI
jgi:cardiolipin synthase